MDDNVLQVEFNTFYTASIPAQMSEVHLAQGVTGSKHPPIIRPQDI